MKKAFFLSIFLIIIGLLMQGGIVQSGASHNVSGWAWSENIGWISFNNISGGGTIDYGVNIDGAGNFSGCAWSENIGWISFNQTDLTGCPQGSCMAQLNTETRQISGWARALANNSGWDGWISLNGTNYNLSVNGESGEFEGWTWGSNVIGWLRFAGPVINSNGLAASWVMDEDSGNYVYDSSGNDNTGTLGDGTCTPGSGKCPDWVLGRYGSALSFDGEDDYINVPHSSSLMPTEAITVEAWIKPSDVSGTKDIVGKYRSTPQTGYQFRVTNGQLRGIIGTGEEGRTHVAGTIDINIWTHVAMSYDGQKIILYVNGQSFTNDFGTVADIALEGRSLIISDIWFGSPFNGLIDEVRIYNRALTQGEIIAAHNGYKVITSFSFNYPPVASISCDASGCSGGECGANWIAYQPTADPTPCIYTIRNNSTDPDGLLDIVKSEWFIKKQAEPDSAYVLKTSCVRCDYTPQNMAADNYSIRLRVEDSQGLSSLIDHAFIMREEVEAGFMCSPDNITWKNCNSFSVSENELVYFKDDQSLSEHSDPSSGAVSITSRIWTKNGIQFGSGINPSTTITKNEKTIRLTVVDSNGRTDYVEHMLSVKMNLPDWQEIAPF